MFTNLNSLVRFDKEGGGEGSDGPTDWDAYVATLSEDQRTLVTKLYTDKNQGLLNTVKAVRDERDTLATELRDAAKKAEKGSSAEAELLDKANKLEEANRKADFYESAPTQQCLNPKAAFKIAVAGSLFTKAGLPDWTAIKEEAPQLFGVVVKPKGKGGAGEGTGKETRGQTVNDFIRSAASKNKVTTKE